ncbi:hypothetical protein JEQ12_015811 [Ovis aries]|uniref:Ig-like domain-containing protein n=1 Tax=Ovis aries TaxID=9940 RepID=A0A836AJ40_SHEEP|nr:hypothetical protein JEQ12_015811 [Ovis aries]
MGNQVICCVALCLFGAGTVAGEVTQTPKYLLKKEGGAVTLECEQDFDYDSMYWYRQDPAGSGLGAVVSQQPRRAVSKSGASVTIECRAVDFQATAVFWYRQFPKRGLVLMATSNAGTNATYEQGYNKDKLPISQPNLTFSSLMSIESSTNLPSFEKLSDTSGNSGSMDTEVIQSPSHLVKGKDQKAKMDCVPIKGHSYVYWYRKKPEGAFEFLVYLQNQDVVEDTAMFKQQFSAECPQNSPCSLEIKSTKAADSALYFCASSQSTVLHVSSS